LSRTFRLVDSREEQSALQRHDEPQLLRADHAHLEHVGMGGARTAGTTSSTSPLATAAAAEATAEATAEAAAGIAGRCDAGGLYDRIGCGGSGDGQREPQRFGVGLC
tara:strand:+ start:5436 stop:5756 length:321 start_codon:yes stop_codon:yes gene_type:complete